MRIHRRTRLGVLMIGMAVGTAAGDAAAQVISGVEPAAITRRHRLVVRGSGFGAEQGNSQLLIGGVPAIVTSWNDVRIKAYVPVGTPLGATTVQVIASGPSNVAALDVLPDAAPTGRIKWMVQTDHYYSLARPAVGPDGTVYATGAAGPLYAIDPRGFVKWTKRGGGVRPAAVGADGTVYYPGGGATITAASPEGRVLWQYTSPENAGTMFIGPNVGPDGKIYAVTEEEPVLKTDFGAFALNPDGTLAWNTSGGFNFRHSPNGWEVAFAAGRVAFPTGQGFPSAGNPGVHALEMDDGDIVWTRVGIADVQSDINGNLYWLGAINNNYIGSYESDGDERWVINYSRFQGQPAELIVSPNGTAFYHPQTLAPLVAINTDGSVRWEVSGPHGLGTFGAVPDNSGVIVVEYQNSPRRRSFQLRSSVDGSLVWEQLIPFENEVWMSPSWAGQFSPDGRTFYISGTGNNTIENPYCYLYAIDVGGECRADYNADGVVGSTDFFDFLTDFFANDADFDGDGATTSQDLFDFLGEFFVGC